LKTDKLIQSVKLPDSAMTKWRKIPAAPQVPPLYGKLKHYAIIGFITGFIVDNLGVRDALYTKNI
jgi:hypothetical protein